MRKQTGGTLNKRNRILLIVLACVVLPYPIAMMMAHVGLWTGLVLLMFVGVVSGAVALRSDVEVRRARRAHLASRTAIEVEEQLRVLVEQNVIPSSVTTVMIEDWMYAARRLRVAPGLMRWTDRLDTDYQLGALTVITGDAQWLIEDLGLMLEKTAGFKCIDAERGGVEYCSWCRYDVSGSEQGSSCPECGRLTLRVRTLGDVLEIAAGIHGGVTPGVRLDGRWTG